MNLLTNVSQNGPGRIHARGFSLLELMVVLGIIAIMALFAIPSYTASSLKSNREQVAEAYAHIERLKPLVAAHYALTDECPDNASEAVEGYGIAAANAYSGHFTNSVKTGGESSDDGDCTITAQFKSTGVTEVIQNTQLAVRLFGVESGVPKWACHTSAEQAGYLIVPKVCRFASSTLAQAAQAPESAAATPSDSE